jgi:hypothetical protein
VNQQEAEILAQLLATEIANSGRYAVFPRTKAIEKVMEEHHIERSGMTDAENIKTIGEAVNAHYVLSANVRKVGGDNYFSASILHIVEASQGKGTYEKYQTVNDGLTLMPKIAQTLTGTAAPAENTTPTGEAATGFTYDAGNGIAVITGYTGSAKNVRIPDQINGLPVTMIGDNAFREKQLTSVTLPDSVTVIGEAAFYKNQLTSVTIPNGVTTIGNFAFQSNRLTGVTIPDSVITIGSAAFRENRLTSIAISNGITVIGNSAFYGNQLTSVTIPGSVTAIEGFAFYQNRLTSVTISHGVIAIGVRAFGQNRLTSITIPASVKTIGESAFQDNPLTRVTIGASVSVGYCPFGGFFNDFQYVYERNRSRAGTYTSRDGGYTWRKP